MVIVQAFARYRELLGFQRLDVPLPEPPTLVTLLADPRFQALPPEALLAVNQAFAERSTMLKEGDEVALMPPVSGG
jgi:molybdopterin converting factor small subunit